MPLKPNSKRLYRDVARCDGIEGHRICEDCLRRMDVDPHVIYAWIAPVASDNACPNKISLERVDDTHRRL